MDERFCIVRFILTPKRTKEVNVPGKLFYEPSDDLIKFLSIEYHLDGKKHQYNIQSAREIWQIRDITKIASDKDSDTYKLDYSGPQYSLLVDEKLIIIIEFIQ